VKDCGACNVCGDGKCTLLERDNCFTCPGDCACPNPTVCGRRDPLPPDCVLPQFDCTPQLFTFCLVAPGRQITECSSRVESVVKACTREAAATTAQSGAANYTLHDGACPPCS
jgi:hypothetical protein